MKKTLYFLTIVLSTIGVFSMSSCLKDNSHYLNFNTGETLVDFPLGGKVNFSTSAITDQGDTVTRTIAINVASANLPSQATTVKVGVNSQSVIDAYKATDNSVDYLTMPAGSYSMPATSFTIPAGKQYVEFTVTFYKNKLDPSKSYMFPIQILSASGNNAKLTANLNVYYVHIIGNDFAGAYTQSLQRYNSSDSTSGLAGGSFSGQPAIFNPVSPTEFTVSSGYAGGAFEYDVTFTKNADGTYSDFAVSFTPASVTSAASGSITVGQAPVFFSGGKPATATLAGPFTKAQAFELFHFQYIALYNGSPRYLIDTFVK